jgi:hypothetical protein
VLNSSTQSVPGEMAQAATKTEDKRPTIRTVLLLSVFIRTPYAYQPVLKVRSRISLLNELDFQEAPRRDSQQPLLHSIFQFNLALRVRNEGGYEPRLGRDIRKLGMSP